MNLFRSAARALAVVFALHWGMSVAIAQDGTFEERFKDLIAAAQKEGELTWYQSSLADAGRDFAADFQSRFGIKTNQIYLAGSPNLERFRSESRADHNIADVFTASDGTLMLPALSEGLIADYRTASHDEFPKEWLLVGNGITVYPTGRVQMTLAYNSQLVSAEEIELLRGWKGLIDPAFNGGRLSLADATRIGAVYPSYLYLLRDNAKEYGRSFLEEFAALDPVVFGGMTEQVARVAAGEVDAGLLVDLVAIQQYKRGAPIAWNYPTPTPITLHYTGVSSKAPHPHAARLFLEYFTSEEGVTEWAKIWGASTGRPDVDEKVPPQYATEAWYKAPTEFYQIQDWDYASQQHKGVLEEWSEIFQK